MPSPSSAEGTMGHNDPPPRCRDDECGEESHQLPSSLPTDGGGGGSGGGGGRDALKRRVARSAVVIASLLALAAVALVFGGVPDVREDGAFRWGPDDDGGEETGSENHRNLVGSGLGGFTPFSSAGRNNRRGRDRCRPWCRLADAQWLDTGLLRTGGEAKGDVEVLLEDVNEAELDLRRRRYKCDWTYHCSGCPECADVPPPPAPPPAAAPPKATSPGDGDGDEDRPPIFPCDEEICYDLSSERRDDEICRFHSCRGCAECSDDPPPPGDNDGPSDDIIDGLEFYAIADTPYDDDQLRQLMKSVGRVPSTGSFLVHLGDMQKPKYSLCARTQYEVVSYVLRQSAIPVFVLPGDNDFNDCPDVPQAVRYFDRYFGDFDRHWVHDLNVTRQPGRSTNFAFLLDGVLFMGVNVVGGTIHDEEEWKRRHADGVEWVRRNLEEHSDDYGSAVLFGHAAPSKRRHPDFFPIIEKYVEDMGDRPFMYLHGDGHRWRIKEDAFQGDLRNAVWVQLEGEMAPSVKITVGDGRVEEDGGGGGGRKRKALDNFRFDRTATDEL